jgi:RNA-directed DNA polymerase
VRRNRGAAGIDRQTIEQIERDGIGRVLDELEADLRDGGSSRRTSPRVLR